MNEALLCCAGASDASLQAAAVASAGTQQAVDSPTPTVRSAAQMSAQHKGIQAQPVVSAADIQTAPPASNDTAVQAGAVLTHSTSTQASPASTVAGEADAQTQAMPSLAAAGAQTRAVSGTDRAAMTQTQPGTAATDVSTQRQAIRGAEAHAQVAPINALALDPVQAVTVSQVSDAGHA